jgi:hypothetical protein
VFLLFSPPHIGWPLTALRATVHTEVGAGEVDALVASAHLKKTSLAHTVNPALLTSSFVWLIQLCLLHISLFKVIIRKYFSQGKYELMNFLFVLLDKLKIFTL